MTHLLLKLNIKRNIYSDLKVSIQNQLLQKVCLHIHTIILFNNFEILLNYNIF